MGSKHSATRPTAISVPSLEGHLTFGSVRDGGTYFSLAGRKSSLSDLSDELLRETYRIEAT